MWHAVCRCNCYDCKSTGNVEKLFVCFFFNKKRQHYASEVHGHGFKAVVNTSHTPLSSLSQEAFVVVFFLLKKVQYVHLNHYLRLKIKGILYLMKCLSIYCKILFFCKVFIFALVNELTTLRIQNRALFNNCLNFRTA